MGHTLRGVIFPVKDNVLAGRKILGAEERAEIECDVEASAVHHDVTGGDSQIEELGGLRRIVVIILLPASFVKGPA